MAQETCPVCNGTGRIPCNPNKPADTYRYWAGYDAATHTLPCKNCGGQYMYGTPSGKVPLNKEGLPCKHEYREENVGRCYTRNTCLRCGDVYHIDSGD